MILTVKKDPMGAAIRDYFEKGKAMTLKVTSTLFDDDEMPVAHLFRTLFEMSPIERQALSLCHGRILDVGAGAGCHSIALQEQGADVTAIDVSPLSVETMRRRGIEKVELADFFTSQLPSEKYDTLLLLMNGLGILGKIDKLPAFFHRLDEILAPGGCVLTDNSDLRYIFEDEDGQFDPSDFDMYYGEVDYQMQYGKIKGDSFDWVYIDADTLSQAAEQCGYKVEIVRQGEHYDYLAKITKA